MTDKNHWPDCDTSVKLSIESLLSSNHWPVNKFSASATFVNIFSYFTLEFKDNLCHSHLGPGLNQLEMIRFSSLARTVAFFLAKVSKHLPNFFSEERTHEAVNIHVQSSVSDQTKMTDVDRNECPGCKWGHPSFFAHVSVLQCEYFMYINANLKLRINFIFCLAIQYFFLKRKVHSNKRFLNFFLNDKTYNYVLFDMTVNLIIQNHAS